jgi:hypothetical protein
VFEWVKQQIFQETMENDGKFITQKGLWFPDCMKLTSDICPAPLHLWIPLEGAAVLADNAIVAETARSHPKPLLVQASHPRLTIQGAHPITLHCTNIAMENGPWQ